MSEKINWSTTKSFAKRRRCWLKMFWIHQSATSKRCGQTITACLKYHFLHNLEYRKSGVNAARVIQHRKAKLSERWKLCTKYHSNTKEFWPEVMFSDEVDSDGTVIAVFQTQHQSRLCCRLKTQITLCDAQMDNENYLNDPTIWTVSSIAASWKILSGGSVFQQDNCPVHKSKKRLVYSREENCLWGVTGSQSRLERSRKCVDWYEKTSW